MTAITCQEYDVAAEGVPFAALFDHSRMQKPENLTALYRPISPQKKVTVEKKNDLGLQYFLPWILMTWTYNTTEGCIVLLDLTHSGNLNRTLFFKFVASAEYAFLLSFLIEDNFIGSLYTTYYTPLTILLSILDDSYLKLLKYERIPKKLPEQWYK